MNRNSQIISDFLKITTSCYIIILLLVFPLIYHNNYIDIVQTKKYTFLLATAIYVVICVIGTFLLHEKEKWQFDSIDIWAGILFISLVLSTIFAGDKFDALWGGSGRYLGAIVIFAAIAGYFFVSRYFVMSQMILWSFLVGSGCVFLLNILNTFQIDILHMKDNLAPGQHYFFIGTMGNIDTEAEYIAIMLPIGMLLFYYAKESFSKWMYGIYIWLGFAAMLCCRCDTAMVCVAVAFLLLYWFGFDAAENLHKVQNIFLLWMTASICVGILKYAFFERVYEFDGLCKIAVSVEFIVLEVILWGLLEGYLFFIKKKGKCSIKAARNVLYGCLGIGVVIFVITMVLVNAFETLPVEGTFLECLKITDTFGNHRGYIWKRSARAYIDAPFFRKVFGYGMNQFPVFIRDYEEEMLQLFQLAFGDAHNEYLQILSTIGMVGAIGYFGMFLACFMKCIQQIKKEQTLPVMLGTVVLVIYFVQGIANNPQVFTTPLYFIFIGIIMKSFRKGYSSKER